MLNKKTKKVVIIGGGYGFYEILSLIDAINKNGDDLIEIIGILDDNKSIKSIRNYPVIGPITSWREVEREIYFVFSIGSYNSRISRRGVMVDSQIPVDRFLSLIHPGSEIMIPLENIGFGSIIYGGVKIHPLTSIGNFCAISANCVIGVNNIVGSFSLFAAGVYTATNIRFGACSFMGTNSVIAPDLSIGVGAQIGVGSVVFRNVEPGYKYLGNPAKAYSKDLIAEDLLRFDINDASNLRFLSDKER